MFTTPHEPITTWSKTTHGRGKRLFPTNVGFYVIEHISTGKLLVGVSKQVSRDVDIGIEQLLKGIYPSAAFNKLVSLCPDLRLHEYSTGSIAEAKKSVEALIKTITPTYLFIPIRK